MVADSLNTLLTELGRALKMKLTPDVNNSCLIPFGSDLKVQMEMSRDKKTFIIGCVIGVVPLGRFREDVFREALLYNGSPTPHIGTFAYSEKKDALIFYKALPLYGLTGDQIAAYLPTFVEKAKTWQTEIENGRIPVGIEADSPHSTGGGLFGLMR